jgi:hypothetical protein
MRSKLCITLFLALGVLFLLQPAARADVVMSLVSDPYGQPGPYVLSVNGTNTWLFCDDFVDHIGIGSTWSAQVIYGATGDLSQTQMALRNKWTQTQANGFYDAKAWIELGMTDANRTLYNEAIWYIFNTSLNFGSDQAAVLALVAQAETGVSAGLHQYVTVYSPTSLISSGPYTGEIAQEFDQVPDGGMTLMLLGGTLVGIATLRRKFRV